MSVELEIAREAARLAAAIIRRGFHTDVPAEFKGEVDPVTVIDRRAEDAIRDLLAREVPGDRILGEERGGDSWSDGRVWILDPLDGTVNFIHRVPHVAVSVAVWEDGRPVAGVVHDPFRDEVFSAVDGEGGDVSGTPVAVSRTKDLSGALVATGFPYDRRERSTALADVVGRVLGRAQGIRRLGSAALDLCWVAAGRFDAYWEYDLEPWDVAAGALVLAEAGGRTTDLRGAAHRLDANGIVATNGLVHEELLGIVGEP